MDRVFLAIIVSGVLLIAVSTSLFVLLNGGATTVSVNMSRAIMPTERTAPADRPTR
jgi:hypothetical protein